jgi:hypothetical protein
MLSETDTWDVAVVGAGPTGLLLSAELAAKKVGVVVLERAEVASSIPKANGIVGHAAVELAKRGIFKGTGLRVVSPQIPVWPARTQTRVRTTESTARPAHCAPEDLYLISTHEPSGGAEPSGTATVEELGASLNRVLGAELPFTEATAIRSTVGNSRQADAYRLGRAFRPATQRTSSTQADRR